MTGVGVHELLELGGVRALLHLGLIRDYSLEVVTN